MYGPPFLGTLFGHAVAATDAAAIVTSSYPSAVLAGRLTAAVADTQCFGVELREFEHQVSGGAH